MIGVKPEKVLFDSATDVVDFVSKGLPPKKEDLESLMTAVENPIDEEAEAATGVYIPTSLFMDIDNATLASVLRRVDENNRRKRNALLIGGGITLAAVTGLFIATTISHKREVDRLEDKIDELKKEVNDEDVW